MPLLRKLIAGSAIAAAAATVGIATADTASAGITNCRWSYGQAWGGFPAGGTSYCDWTSSNTKRHQIRLTGSNGVYYYGPIVNGGQGSSRNLPYGVRVVGAITVVHN